MTVQICSFKAIGLCFQPAVASPGSQIFGIADLLATAAIFVAAYSLSDDRYKFRIAASGIPFQYMLFLATALGGFFLLAENVWFALNLPIPSFLNNPIFFQAFIAAILIAVLSAWIHQSFVRPPRFSNRNAVPFAQQVFRGIADGSEKELAAVVYEVGRSAGNILIAARRRIYQRNLERGGVDLVSPRSAQIASDILLLIGDRRFCRLVAQQFPWVAAEVFQAAAVENSRGLPLAQFSRNVANEFFADERSAIHHEDEGYRSGLIGYLKPVSKALFGNSKLIDTLTDMNGSPIDLLWLDSSQWSLRSWGTYNKAVLLYLTDHLDGWDNAADNTTLNQVFYGYEHASYDLYKVNEMDEASYYSSLPYGKAASCVSLINDVLNLLEKKKITADRKAFEHEGRFQRDTIFDGLAELAFKLISAAGSVDTGEFRNWSLQHNTIWSPLMDQHSDAIARQLFRGRLQRLIWKEISQMSSMPNYVSAHVLAISLNTMGFRTNHAVFMPKATRGLKRRVLRWARENFLSLFADYPEVARSCVGGTISIDQEANRLVKTYRGSLGREPAREFLDLQPARPKVPAAP